MDTLTRVRVHLRTLPPRQRAVVVLLALCSSAFALTHVIPAPASLLLEAVTALAFLRLLAVTAVAFMCVTSPGPLTSGPAIGSLAAWTWQTLTRRP